MLCLFQIYSTVIYMACVALSVFVLCAESLPHFWDYYRDDAVVYVTGATNLTNTTISNSTFSVNQLILTIELITNTLFTVDWILRLITCPSIKLCLLGFPFWINLVSITSSWIVIKSYIYGSGLVFRAPYYVRVCAVLRCLRTLRVLRIFYVMRGYEIMLLSMKQSIWEISILGAFFLTGMLIFSTLIYYAEYSENTAFPTIPIGFWWSIVTMTSVGYGDFVPTTTQGYVVGGLCAITGMFAASLPIPVISENFRQARNNLQLVQDFRQRTKQRSIIDKNDENGFVCPVCQTRSFMERPSKSRRSVKV